MFEARFLARPEFNRFPGYPIAVGHILNEPAHTVNGTRYPSGFYNFHFVIQGSGWLTTPGGTINLQPGTGFLYSANQKQHFGSDKDDPWEVWWIYFSGEGLRELLGDKCLGEVWAFSFEDNDRIEALVQELWKLSGLKKMSLVTRLAGLLYEIILELLLHAVNLNASHMGNLENSIRRASEFMRMNSSRKLTLDTLADYCGISSPYFSRMFHHYIGVPPLEYLNNQRIELSKQMLIATSKSVKQIALETGFSNSSYFIERFRKTEGVTPVGYRERYT